jgi:DNA modification methylase
MLISDLKEYHKNPRKITTERFDKLFKSLKKLGDLGGIIVNLNTNEVIGGNQRVKAFLSERDKYVIELTETFETPINDGTLSYGYVVRDSGLASEQKFSYREVKWDEKQAEEANIVANKVTGAWDFDTLANKFEVEDLLKWGFELNELGLGDKEKLQESGNLMEKFIVPPFSILDTRKGYWQDRKRAWVEKIGNLSESRENTLYDSYSGGDMQFYVKKQKVETMLGHKITTEEYLEKYYEPDMFHGGTSNFDPVVAELMFRWFCREGGKILDPFAGEATKAFVAGTLKMGYVGVELRLDQIKENDKLIKDLAGVKFVNGDSNKLSEVVTEGDFDMVFTSPPYYDLEVYSKEDMSALGTYEEFMAGYESIFKQCYGKMKDNSFLVLKVGEIRDKKTGKMRNFVGDNISVMERIGFNFYNKLILVNPVSTGAVRATAQFRSRKIVKVHQDILVFYKGNVEEVRDHYPEMFAKEDFEEMKAKLEIDDKIDADSPSDSLIDL